MPSLSGRKARPPQFVVCEDVSDEDEESDVEDGGGVWPTKVAVEDKPPLMSDVGHRRDTPPTSESTPGTSEPESGFTTAFVLQLCCISLLGIIDTMARTSILSYGGFLVLHTNPELSESEAGFKAGWIASAFSFAQLVSAFAWGRLADRFGARRILLCGQIATTVSSVAFGLSSTFGQAVAFRSMCGLFNGNVGVAKAYLGRITTKKTEARSFSVIALSAGVGRVLGPALGGFLSQPCDKYGSSFCGSIFEEYPFLLPNLVIAAVSMFAFAFGFKYLEDACEVQRARLLDATPLSSPSGSLRGQVGYAPVTIPVSDDTAVEDSKDSNDGKVQGNGYTPVDTHKGGYDDEEEDDIFGDEAIQMVRLQAGSNGGEQSHTPQQTQCVVDVSSPGVDGGGNSKHVFISGPQPVTTTRELLSMRNPLVATAMYGCYALVFIGIDEVWPLVALAPVEQGGLGWNSSNIGTVLVVGGVCLFCFQAFVWPHVAKCMGPLRTARYNVLLIFPVCILLVPFLNTVAAYPWLVWSLAVVFAFLRFGVMSLGMTSCFLLINRSVAVENLGQVNGLGQTCAAAARTIGPVACGSLLAWSLNNPYPHFPLGSFLLFEILCVLSFLTFWLTLLYRMEEARSLGETEANTESTAETEASGDDSSGDSVSGH